MYYLKFTEDIYIYIYILKFSILLRLISFFFKYVTSCSCQKVISFLKKNISHFPENVENVGDHTYNSCNTVLQLDMVSWLLILSRFHDNVKGIHLLLQKMAREPPHKEDSTDGKQGCINQGSAHRRPDPG